MGQTLKKLRHCRDLPKTLRRKGWYSLVETCPWTMVQGRLWMIAFEGLFS
jgi:hypothetical protein